MIAFHSNDLRVYLAGSAVGESDEVTRTSGSVEDGPGSSLQEDEDEADPMNSVEPMDL
jgi:hypothetical protein